jgi:hypothetical protein
MDFEAAERERVERDGSLKEDYAQRLPPSNGNLYLMPPSSSAPAGRLVNADEVLYHPAVISDNLAESFGDLPKQAQRGPLA